MVKDVLIKIKGTNEANGEKNTVELKTVGKMGKREGKTYLIYDESESIGTKGVKTTLKIDGQSQVVLQRTGALTSRLIIENGMRHNCCYSTVQGDIQVGVFGEKITSSLKDNGGNLYMRYTVDVNMGLISRNEIEISVKEVQ